MFKHIEVWYHFFRKCIAQGKLRLEKVFTVNNVPDTMIKGLLKDQFWSLWELMSIELIQEKSQ